MARSLPGNIQVEITRVTPTERQERRRADLPFIGGLALTGVAFEASYLLPDGHLKTIAAVLAGGGALLSGLKTTQNRWSAMRNRNIGRQ